MYRKPFIAIAFVLVFLFAGTTMTAYAAQGSLPGDALYGVKTKMEDLQLNASWDTAGEVEKSITYADRRIQEIVELVNRKRAEDIPVGVNRFEHHLREALGALSVIAKNDPELAQVLAVNLAVLLEEQSAMITALMESNPDANQMALSEALTAAFLSRDTVGSIAGVPDDNGNENGDDAANDNGDDADDVNDDANEYDDDDDAAEYDDDDDAAEYDDDDDNDGNEYDDDDEGNENDDDDDANENDNDDDANENDDDDNDGNENDDDDDGNDDDDDDDDEDDEDDDGDEDDDRDDKDDDDDND